MSFNPNKPLSQCEKDVIVLICYNFSNKQMAELLKKSIKTVEHHRESSYRKTKVNTILGLLQYALKHKIVDFEKWFVLDFSHKHSQVVTDTSVSLGKDIIKCLTH